ncbi:MAG: hypothetical protein ACK44M_09425, partial [Chloroflexus sp.]
HPVELADLCGDGEHEPDARPMRTGDNLLRAALAAGADGLIVEVHDNPAYAVCDGTQSLVPDSFADMMRQIARIAAAVDRPLVSSVYR